MTDLSGESVRSVAPRQPQASDHGLDELVESGLPRYAFG